MGGRLEQNTLAGRADRDVREVDVGGDGGLGLGLAGAGSMARTFRRV